jgi:hypothetical protein
MRFSGFAVKVVPALCVAGVVLLVGVMCQKSKCAQTEPAKPAVAAAVPAAAVTDTAKKTDTAAVKPAVDTAVATAVAGYYTCPMHPKIHQAKPGKCPMCKMDLVFKKEITKAITKVKAVAKKAVKK